MCEGRHGAKGWHPSGRIILSRDEDVNCVPSDNIMVKWVVNLSFSPLTEAQKSLLSRAPSFGIVPKYSSKEEYIAAVEEVCLKLLRQQQNLGQKPAVYLEGIAPQI